MNDLFDQTTQAERKRPNRAPKEPPVYRPLTDLERRRIEGLQNVSFFPGTAAKRFAREIAAQVAHLNAITDKQAHYVGQLAWKFRRQIPRNLVRSKKPVAA